MILSYHFNIDAAFVPSKIVHNKSYTPTKTAPLSILKRVYIFIWSNAKLFLLILRFFTLWTLTIGVRQLSQGKQHTHDQILVKLSTTQELRHHKKLTKLFQALRKQAFLPGFRNPGKVCLWWVQNPGLWKNSGQGILNSANDLESKSHW